MAHADQTSLQHLQLRLAADAARASLTELQFEYNRVARRMVDMTESMQMLQNVIDAWERLNPDRDSLARQLVRIDQELRASDPATVTPRFVASPFAAAVLAAAPQAAAQAVAHEAAGTAAAHFAQGAAYARAAGAGSHRPVRSEAPTAVPQPSGAARHPEPWPARGEIAERVHRVLLNGMPLSPNEAHAAIDARYRTAYSINAVSIAMRHGAEAGHYVYNGKTGRYRIAAGG